MRETHRRKTALVLSGGGAYGAYEVGVLKALLSGRSPATGFEPLVPDIVTGTSVGAYNASFLVARLAGSGARAAEELEQTWLERIAGGPGRCGNGVFRVRLDPLEYVRPACYVPNPLRPLKTTAEDTVYFATQLLTRTASALRSNGPPLARAIEEVDLSAMLDTQPYDELIRETIDFDAIRRSPIALSVFATAWKTGLPRRYDNGEGTLTAEAVQASASIPGVFPPTAVDGELFVDGGLSINTPLAPAIRAGAEVLHIVFLDPRVGAIPMRWPLSTVAELYRILAILFANETRAQIAQIDQGNRALGPSGAASGESGESRRPIEVHVYRPSPDILQGLAGFLDFERSYVEKLIQAGQDDAVRPARHPVTSGTIPLDPRF